MRLLNNENNVINIKYNIIRNTYTIYVYNFSVEISTIKFYFLKILLFEYSLIVFLKYKHKLFMLAHEYSMN